MEKINKEVSYPPLRVGWLLIPAIVLFCVVHDAWTIWRFPRPDKSSIEIRLDRTMCLGNCPEYNVTIYGNGAVVFEGFSGVSAVGIWKRQADPRRVQELARQIERAGFLDQQYEDLPGGFDYPEAVLSVQIGPRHNVARHLVGTDYPTLKPLEDLEADIESVADSMQWIGNGVPNRVGYSAFFWLLGALPLLTSISITQSGRNAGRGLAGLAIGLLVGGIFWLIGRALVVGGYYVDPLHLWDPLGAVLYVVGVFACVRTTVRV